MKIIDKENIIQLVKEFGESFYILDSDVFTSNYKELLNSFKKFYPNTNIAYSYKTNYIPKLVKIVNSIGGFAEVVSEMELELALKVGVPYNKIVWNGPVKNIDRVKNFLLNGGTVNIDSLYELMNICKSIDRNNSINIGLRCNFDIGDNVLSRFGIDVNSEEFDDFFKVLLNNRNINLIALHSHFANRNPKYWCNRTNGLIEIYDRVVNTYNIKPRYLDLGGAMYGKLPIEIQEALHVDDIHYDEYAAKSASIFADKFKDTEDKPWLYVEPGTAIAANCMRYICRIETIKRIRDKIIITTNGSQKNISMNGINPPISIIRMSNDYIECNNANIGGYTCIESDYLCKNFSGKVNVGDYIIIENCGSYSVVMKPPFIEPNVPIIDISGERIELVKRKENFNDIFNTYVY